MRYELVVLSMLFLVPVFSWIYPFSYRELLTAAGGGVNTFCFNCSAEVMAGNSTWLCTTDIIGGEYVPFSQVYFPTPQESCFFYAGIKGYHYFGSFYSPYTVTPVGFALFSFDEYQNLSKIFEQHYGTFTQVPSLEGLAIAPHYTTTATVLGCFKNLKLDPYIGEGIVIAANLKLSKNSWILLATYNKDNRIGGVGIRKPSTDLFEVANFTISAGVLTFDRIVEFKDDSADNYTVILIAFTPEEIKVFTPFSSSAVFRADNYINESCIGFFSSLKEENNYIDKILFLNYSKFSGFSTAGGLERVKQNLEIVGISPASYVLVEDAAPVFSPQVLYFRTDTLKFATIAIRLPLSAVFSKEVSPDSMIYRTSFVHNGAKFWLSFKVRNRKAELTVAANATTTLDLRLNTSEFFTFYNGSWIKNTQHSYPLRLYNTSSVFLSGNVTLLPGIEVALRIPLKEGKPERVFFFYGDEYRKGPLLLLPNESYSLPVKLPFTFVGFAAGWHTLLAVESRNIAATAIKEPVYLIATNYGPMFGRYFQEVTMECISCYTKEECIFPEDLGGDLHYHVFGSLGAHRGICVKELGVV